MDVNDLEYVGFWPRVGASLLDTILICIVTFPLVTMYYGSGYWLNEALIAGPVDFLLTWVLPAVAVIFFWMKVQATPGKMAISAKLVDAATGRTPTTGQCIGRYFGYFASMIPFGLGFLWVLFDKRKQGWHDKLAGTVVVRSRHREPEPVVFRGH